MLKKYFYKKVSKTLCIVMAIALALSPSMESYAYDDGNRDDNSFVHVNNESASKGADSDILFTDLLSHGVSYLNNQSKEKYGDEWNIFTLLSADENIEKSDKKRYVNDVWKLLNEDCENVKQKKASKLKPTDYARLIIALTCLEIDPTNFYGYDLVEKLYNYKTMDSSPSNYVAWS